MQLRVQLLSCENCCFDAKITADYGDEVYQFSMTCRATSDGTVTFSVTEPERLAGIAGTIASGAGELTFDDTALSFPLLADDQVTPISGPWILMKTLLGGYLTDCVQEEDLLHLTIDDSYEEDAMQLEIWLDEQDAPVAAEIYYDQRRIVTMEVENFRIQ